MNANNDLATIDNFIALRNSSCPQKQQNESSYLQSILLKYGAKNVQPNHIPDNQSREDPMMFKNINEAHSEEKLFIESVCHDIIDTDYLFDCDNINLQVRRQ
jgi:hypothetical protein